MKIQLLAMIVAFLSIVDGHAQVSDAKSALSHLDNQYFIENKGQWPDDVLYLTRISGLDAWITKHGVLYDFYQLEELQYKANTEEPLPNKFEVKDYTKNGHKVYYKFQSNNNLVQTEGKGKQTGYHNYLIGNNLNKQASNVGLYRDVLVKNIYNGIDVHYYFDKGSIRYDYIVHPGADPSQIVFTLEGADKTNLSTQGDLVFNTRFGEIKIAELHTYQSTKDNKVNSSFVRKSNGWSIALGNYNHQQTLIIDPLIYSTYMGGSGIDNGNAIVIDVFGNAYVTGNTNSANYNTVSGAYQSSNAGDWEVFVTKINNSGTALVYSTYLGGSNFDMGSAIAIDGSGIAYITGTTWSTDYDTSSGAYKTVNVGGYGDAFVTKLNATGTAIVYSSYLGGNREEEASNIKIDSLGNAYVTGQTASSDFSITSGAYQTVFGGNWDVFVTKLNATGTALVYSTYIGGSGEDRAYSLAIDTGGNAFVTGNTSSNNYVTTAGAFQTLSGGSMDVFVTKLNAAGTALIYSTYLGGSGGEYGYAIAVNASGNAYITGYTSSSNFDTTAGAYQTSLAGASDVFVTKLNAAGSALVYSTYIGGSGGDVGYSIAIDASGVAYVAGWSNSINYDTTSGAYQTNLAGGFDAFITKLNATGKAIVYSTYLGGSTTDRAFSIAIDAWDNAYITGNTTSTNYKISSGAYQTSIAGTWDIFITRICLVARAEISLSSNSGTDSQSVCLNIPIANITYSTINASNATVTGLPSGVTSSFASNVITISGTPTVSGTFPFTVILVGGCGTITAKGNIIVKPIKTIALSSATGTDSQSVNVNVPISNITYASSGATGATFAGLPAGVTGSFVSNVITISGTPSVSGTYNFTITLTGGCGNVSAGGRIIVGDLGLLDKSRSQTLQLFPNPSDVFVNIHLPHSASVQIDIVDALGRLRQANYVQDNITIKLQVTTLENGIYCIRISDEGSVFQSKIIVQH